MLQQHGCGQPSVVTVQLGTGNASPVSPWDTPVSSKLKVAYLRVTEGLRWEGTSGGHLVQPPLLKQGHLQPVDQDRVQTACEYLQGWRLYSLSGQLCWVSVAGFW